MILDNELTIVRKLPLFANLPPDVLGVVLQLFSRRAMGKLKSCTYEMIHQIYFMSFYMGGAKFAEKHQIVKKLCLVY